MFDLLGAQRRIFTSTLKPLERLVALAILNFYSRKAPKPFPSVDTLALNTGMGRRAVMRAIAGLEAVGGLVVVRGKGVSNRYDITGLMRLPVREGDQCLSDTSASEEPVPLEHPTSASGDTTTSASGDTLSNPLKKPNKEPTTHAPDRREVPAPVGAGSSKAKKAKSSKPKKAKFEPAPGAHKQVVDFYFSEFERSRGCKPVFGGAEGTAVTNLLGKLDKHGGADEACKRIRHAFASYRGNSVTILTIAREPDAFSKLELPRGVVSAQHGPNDADVIRNARRRNAPLQASHGLTGFEGTDR